MNKTVTIVKSDGTREIFVEEKLANSLKRVGATPEAIEDILDEINSQLRDGMTTDEIYSKAFSLLKSHSAPIAIKYSIRRAMFDLGPDGFPFEKFIARIFKLWGYDAVTDQIALGKCVEHEIDVVAWKGDSLAMVEAKFHNTVGMKSDLRVALYVKARYDDLADNLFDYGGKKRKITERWLATNTKFTDRAIKYGECNDLKMLGWNYPAHDNIHEIIEKNGLHPITCMNTLSKDQKKEIISQGILTCIDLVANPKTLDGLHGINGVIKEKMLTEAQLIVEQAK